MIEDPQNPYAPPTSDPISDRLSVDSHQLATLGERFVGAFIDGIINMVVFTAVSTALYVIPEFRILTSSDHIETVIRGLVGLVVFIAINLKFLSDSGQTIGKKVAKTRIVTMSGEKPPLRDLLLKRYFFSNLLGIIPIVGPYLSLANILFVFKKDHRCLHDHVAGTQVIKADR